MSNVADTFCRNMFLKIVSTNQTLQIKINVKGNDKNNQNICILREISGFLKAVLFVHK